MIESDDRYQIKFIRHRGDDSVIPVAIRGLNVSRKNPAEQWDGKRTITFVEALEGKEEIQMDDREWWTEADKGSGQVGFLQRGVCSC